MLDLLAIHAVLSRVWRYCAGRLLTDEHQSRTYLPLTGRWIYYLVQGLLTLVCIGAGAYAIWLRLE